VLGSERGFKPLVMSNDFDSSERTAGDFILFGLAFFGFVLAAVGIVVDSPGTAVMGGLMMLLPIASFGMR
jgi:hypothetical protein